MNTVDVEKNLLRIAVTAKLSVLQAEFAELETDILKDASKRWWQHDTADYSKFYPLQDSIKHYKKILRTCEVAGTSLITIDQDDVIEYFGESAN